MNRGESDGVSIRLLSLGLRQILAIGGITSLIPYVHSDELGAKPAAEEFYEIGRYRDGHRVEVRTGGDPKTLGLDFSLQIPEVWTVSYDASRPQVVQRFMRRKDQIWIGGEMFVFPDYTRSYVDRVIPFSISRPTAQEFKVPGTTASGVREFGAILNTPHLPDKYYARCSVLTFVYKGHFAAVSLSVRGLASDKKQIDAIYEELKPDYLKIYRSLKIHGLIETSKP
ncbi:MAG: hypothetical protein QM775_00765 [Pirellulales bacterium]